ncbi:winged helix-turn-helix domain-containing protein [Natronococcus wangiae]|uniref:winged helix-turn-helix domain-containing protein n=1 Tax=Natronococcus wangiae TaxID=3068275 RepID=UPI00273FCA20|nr:helix-turn-helix domain-containing protein [Natronococcus sp. AD5]
MVRDRVTSQSSPSPEIVCSALDDPDCRKIIRNLEEPMTASELNDRCEIPESTLYRKLETLTDSTLLEESVESRQGSHNAKKYSVMFNEITFALDNNQTLSVQVEHRDQRPHERLTELWSGIQKK